MREYTVKSNRPFGNCNGIWTQSDIEETKARLQQPDPGSQHVQVHLQHYIPT